MSTSPSGPDGPVHVGSSESGSSTAGDAVSVPTASATEVATAQTSVPVTPMAASTGVNGGPPSIRLNALKEPERADTGRLWAIVVMFYRATEGGDQSKAALSILRIVAAVVIILGLGGYVATIELGHWIHGAGGGGMIATIGGATGFGFAGISGARKLIDRRTQRRAVARSTTGPASPQPSPAVEQNPPTGPDAMAGMPAGPHPDVEIPPPRAASEHPVAATPSDPTS